MISKATRDQTITWLERAWRDETGASSIEYALVASLISVGILAALTGVSDQLRSTYYALIDGAFK